MSKRRGIIGTVISIGTGALSLAKGIAELWRQSEPETIRPDRHPLDAMRERANEDKGRR